MDKTEACTVINYLQKKGITLKEIHEDMIQILVENSPSNVTVKKLAAEFKQGRDSTEDDSQSSHSKALTTDEQVDTIHCILLDDTHLT